MTVRLSPTNSVNLGSMISFQADGSLFDGRGVVPDIVVEVGPAFFIGKWDDVLEFCDSPRSRPCEGDGIFTLSDKGSRRVTCEWKLP